MHNIVITLSYILLLCIMSSVEEQYTEVTLAATFNPVTKKLKLKQLFTAKCKPLLENLTLEEANFIAKPETNKFTPTIDDCLFALTVSPIDSTNKSYTFYRLGKNVYCTVQPELQINIPQLAWKAAIVITQPNINRQLYIANPELSNWTNQALTKWLSKQQ